MSRRNVSIADRLGDELRFVKTFATSPLKMGTFTPSGRALAEAMVNHATIDPSGWTLEIGPGTGAVTEVLIERGVPPERLVCLEYDADFCRLLQKRFPTANVIQGDALKLDEALGSVRRYSVLRRALRYPASEPAEGEAASLSRKRTRSSRSGRKCDAALLRVPAAAGRGARPPDGRQIEMGDREFPARPDLDLSKADARSPLVRRVLNFGSSASTPRLLRPLPCRP